MNVNTITGQVEPGGSWTVVPLRRQGNRFILYCNELTYIQFSNTVPTDETKSFVIPAGASLDWKDTTKHVWVKSDSTVYYMG